MSINSLLGFLSFFILGNIKGFLVWFGLVFCLYQKDEIKPNVDRQNVSYLELYYSEITGVSPFLLPTRDTTVVLTMALVMNPVCL